MTDLSLPSIEPDTQDGWRARIALAYSPRRERTRLIHCQRIGPLSVQRASIRKGRFVTAICCTHPVVLSAVTGWKWRCMYSPKPIH